MMWHKIGKFMALSKEEKRLFIEAYCELGMMRIKLLLFSIKTLTRSLQQVSALSEPDPADERATQVALQISKAIQSASGHTPWQSACLVQALCAQKMMQRRGMGGSLYLGVKKEEGMHAHAWVHCGNTIVTGADGHEDFKVIMVWKWNSSKV